MAVAQCPECGADLSSLTAAELRAHSLDHWPESIADRAEHRLAQGRQAELQLAIDEKTMAEHQQAFESRQQSEQPERRDY